MRRLAVLVSLAAACREAPPAPPPVEPAPQLVPGIALADVPAPPSARIAPRATPPEVRELGRGVRPARVALPEIPRGATVGFELDGGRGWITRLRHGEAIPTAAYGGGRVYVGGGFSSRSFYALDAETGRIEWAAHEIGDDGPTAPIYEDERVIFNTESCTLFVADAKTGRIIWSKWLGDPTLAQPAVAGGLVFSAYPADTGGFRLGAFRLRDGGTVWSRAIDGELLSAPAVDGDAVYVTTVNGSAYRFARADGERAWVARNGAASAPWISGGEVFLSRVDPATRREQQVVLDAARGELARVLNTVDASWLADVPRHTGDPRRVWAFEGSRPVIAGGRRFETMGGEIRASDPRSGAPLWRVRHAGGDRRRTLTAPAVAAAKVVFATYDGDVYVLDADTGLTVAAHELGVPIRAQPIVARGFVYLTTTTGSVIGLELGDPALDGWPMWGGGPAHNG